MVDTTFAVEHGKTNEWKLIIWLHGLDKWTVIGRVWSNRATRESFVLVWNGIFETIQAVTGKALNFKIFFKTSCLLGAIGNSEGAQAQALGDVIILRCMNTQEVDGSAMVEVNVILMFIWKTCIVHFNHGVFALEAYTDSNTFQYLLSFPYLETTTEILEYYAFCNASTTPKVKTWWMHKISYPWLLPSLNRHLTKMNHKDWDLTPRDTHPIEGSHVQDNQVNHMNHSLIEAILLARQFNSDNVHIIKALIEFGIWESGHNSLHAQFSLQAAHQSRSQVKKAEQEKIDGGAKRLKAKLKASKQSTRDKDLEIQSLCSQLTSGDRFAFSQQSVVGPSTFSRPIAGPSTLQQSISGPYTLRRRVPRPCNDKYSPQDLPNSSPAVTPPLLPQLNVFMGLPPDTVHDPRSDFDYAMALQPEFMDAAIEELQRSSPVHCYPVSLRPPPVQQSLINLTFPILILILFPFPYS
ncbi:hypothetical protein DFH07DRAFT_780072 [Mycena maculata]|uniref:Uncharacterized protein n=1 Tax=Mycena maculata TaxID=230809 RepID=A0AAD7I5C2_9AGAR|nr:hypothetical protein DFH07DRAFT_780072 [Mycena maculata]